jgi:hypothetical protein
VVVRTSVERFVKVAEAIHTIDQREQSTTTRTLTLFVAARCDARATRATEGSGRFNNKMHDSKWLMRYMCLQ